MKVYFKKFRALPGGWQLLISVIALYIIAGVINFRFTLKAFLSFTDTLINIVPILIIVGVFMVITNLIFTRERTTKYLGQGSGLKAWFYTIVSGMVISGAPYILYPMLGELKKRGMKNSLLAVFLFNRNISLAIVPALIYFFGMPFALFLGFYIVIFSIISGIILGRMVET